MRTKTLLLAAAITVAGFVSSQAATVYSQNIVGYVNQKLNGGNAFNLIIAPLQGTTNVNNAEALLGTSLEAGDNLFFWTGTGYSVKTYIDVATWIDGNGDPISIPTIGLGQAFFYQNSGATKTNTFVGAVVLTNGISLTGGNAFNFVGSSAPLAGSIESTNIALPFVTGDNVFQWTGSGFKISTYLDVNTWINANGDPVATPTLNVGEGFFFQNSDVTKLWKQNVIVQ